MMPYSGTWLQTKKMRRVKAVHDNLSEKGTCIREQNLHVRYTLNSRGKAFLNMFVPHMYIIRAMHQNKRPSIFNKTGVISKLFTPYKKKGFVSQLRCDRTSIRDYVKSVRYLFETPVCGVALSLACTRSTSLSRKRE